MMTKAVAMITTMAINGGLKSTGSFDGGDDDLSADDSAKVSGDGE